MKLGAIVSLGSLIDLILAGVVLEALVLLAVRRRSGRGPAPAALLASLAAGASLMLAVRLALSADAAAWIPACLIVSLLAHLADLALRWRRAPALVPGRVPQR